MLVARYAPFDAPEPLFTCVSYGCYRLYQCRQISTSGEGILALRSSATPYLLPATTTNAAKVLAGGM